MNRDGLNQELGVVEQAVAIEAVELAAIEVELADIEHCCLHGQPVPAMEPGASQPAPDGNPCRASAGASMRTILKLSSTLYDDLVQRLREPHDFAAERVAFLKCRPALSATSLLLLAGGVHRVEDADYVDDPSAGATIGRSGLRKALQTAYTEAVSMVHIHLHEHRGRPRFSRTDLRENALFAPDFWNLQPSHPHGAVVFSFDSAVGQCWIPGSPSPSGVEVAIVGSPMRCTWKVTNG